MKSRLLSNGFYMYIKIKIMYKRSLSLITWHDKNSYVCMLITFEADINVGLVNLRIDVFIVIVSRIKETWNKN